MGATDGPLKGPDLASGVPFDSLREGEPLLGHAGGEAALLERFGDEAHAVGATCSHYGGPLAEGLAVDGTVRCPWHHACFDLRTGEALGGPALTDLPCFEVRRDGGLIRVLGKRDVRPRALPVDTKAPTSVVIVGAGPAGTACAEGLRREGYAGPITLLGTEAPVDRPNLSKDYLAGSAPEEWLPLRSPEALAAAKIALALESPVVRIDVAARRVSLGPRTELAEAAGLRVDRGVVVDEAMRTSAPDVYAIGDVARYPYAGELVRIEHISVAERHGRTAALSMLGRPPRIRDVPFFWSAHHDLTLSYVGHAERFDRTVVVGSLATRDAIVGYLQGGAVHAVLTVNRDGESLAAERAFEKGDPSGLLGLLGLAAG